MDKELVQATPTSQSEVNSFSSSVEDKLVNVASSAPVPISQKKNKTKVSDPSVTPLQFKTYFFTKRGGIKNVVFSEEQLSHQCDRRSNSSCVDITMVTQLS